MMPVQFTQPPRTERECGGHTPGAEPPATGSGTLEQGAWPLLLPVADLINLGRSHLPPRVGGMNAT